MFPLFHVVSFSDSLPLVLLLGLSVLLILLFLPTYNELTTQSYIQKGDDDDDDEDVDDDDNDDDALLFQTNYPSLIWFHHVIFFRRQKSEYFFLKGR